MPYGMTENKWQQRYNNWNANPVVQTTSCNWCNHGQGQVCTTKTGNHTQSVHVARIQDYVAEWVTHHTPDGQPL